MDFTTVEKSVRARLANNGRNLANNNAGIKVGSDLHMCEVMLAEIDRLRAIVDLWQDYPTISAKLHDCQKDRTALIKSLNETRDIDAMKLTASNKDDWEPCSPEWLKRHPHDCGVAPRLWCEAEHNHYHPKNWIRPK